MAHTLSIQYEAKGNKTFLLPFALETSADLLVWIDGVLQAPSTYQVDLSPQKDGQNGSIIFNRLVGTVSSPKIVTLQKKVTIDRKVQFLDYGDFSARNINLELDNIFLILDSLKEEVGSSLRLSKCFPLQQTVSLQSYEPGRGLYWGTDGELHNTTLNLEEMLNKVLVIEAEVQVIKRHHGNGNSHIINIKAEKVLIDNSQLHIKKQNLQAYLNDYDSTLSGLQGSWEGVTKNFDSVKQQMDTLLSKVNGYDANFSNFDTKITGYNSRISGIEAAQNSVLLEFGKVQSALTSLQSNYSETISKLTSSVSAYSSQISQAAEDSAKCVQAVQNLSTRVAGYDIKIGNVLDKVSSYDATINDVRAANQSISVRLNSLDTEVKDSLGRYYQSIQDVTTKVNSFDQRIKSAEEKSTKAEGSFANLDQRVFTINTSVAELEQAIADAQDSLDDLSDKVGALEVDFSKCSTLKVNTWQEFVNKVDELLGKIPH